MLGVQQSDFKQWMDLKPSKYLIDTAIQNIEGKITIERSTGASY